MDPTTPGYRRLGQGGEPFLQGTVSPDQNVWTSNVEDYVITFLGLNEYQVAHAGETVVCGDMASAVMLTEMNRLLSGPPRGRGDAGPGADPPPDEVWHT